MSWHEGHLVNHGMKVRMHKGHEAEHVAATSLVCCDWCKGAREQQGIPTGLVCHDWCESKELHATGLLSGLTGVGAMKLHASGLVWCDWCVSETNDKQTNNEQTMNNQTMNEQTTMNKMN
jgi:hypothetical protein